ncbi:MAG: hypothetical protein EOP21_12525, partial [Hyphomicrobiales bacterium]
MRLLHARHATTLPAWRRCRKLMDSEEQQASQMLTAPNNRLSRRAFLSGAAASIALLSSTSLTQMVFAIEPMSGAFDYESFSQRMKDLAAQPYQSPVLIDSPVYTGLNYDGYRRVQFNTEKARWRGDDHGFQIQAFPPGWLFKETVSVYEITDGDAHPFA